MALDQAKCQQPGTDSMLNLPGWYQALTLTERLALLRTEAFRKPGLETIDQVQAESGLHAWKAQSPFDQGTCWAERLAMDGVSEQELLVLLGEQAATGWARLPEPPAWLHELSQAFEQPIAEADLTELAELFASLAEAEEERTRQAEETASRKQSFLPVFYPLLARGVARLQADLAELLSNYPTPPFDPAEVHRLFLPALASQLMRQAARTLTLELHVARLEGRLSGETPQERFQQFVTHFTQPEHLFPLLTEYGSLSRLLVQTMQHWATSSLEVLQHLCTDWDDMCRVLAPHGDPGRLSEVTAGVGDLHQGGRSTLILQFTSGLRLVYKPRSLAVDLHFQQLLAFLNARGDHPPFRVLRVLDKGLHGWSEYVEQEGCATHEEIARFYERQGGYLALLYLLEATDMHHENLIAAGDQPVLVDLEALFHPRPQEADPASSAMLGLETMTNSVLRVGLLPQRIWGDQERAGLDLSGLGGRAGQLGPLPVLQAQARGTDQMRFLRERLSMPEAKNLPRLEGGAVDILEYRDDLLRGFRGVYRLCREHGDALLAGPLQAFAQDPIRVVLRSTRTYALLLSESSHPDLLRDALARDRFFDRLWVQAVGLPHLKPLIAFEREALHRGDIPLFRSRPATRDLWTSDGRCLPDFLVTSSLDAVTQRLRELSEADLARQSWFIEAALATIPMGEVVGFAGSHLVPAEAKATPEHLVRAACAVGERLGSLALLGEHGANWLGVTYVHEREWRLAPAGLDLYSGVAGMAFFLAYLGDLTGIEKYTRLSRAALLNVREQLQQRLPPTQAPGGYGGWGSIFYLYAHLGVLWQDEKLLEEAAEYAHLVPDLLEKDHTFDLIGGAAGTLLCLLALYQVHPHAQVLGAALRCGEWLLTHAAQCQTDQPQAEAAGTLPRPLTGLSHGAAGMAYSLLKLAAVSKQSRFRVGTLAAMAYERRVFSEARQNWPNFLAPWQDSRECLPQAEAKAGAPHKHFGVTWCHGAPGIGLGRLAQLAYLDDDPVLHREIASALRTTLLEGFGRNHSLCHGDLGNLETVLTAAQVLQDARYQEEVARLSAMILQSIETHGWQTGIPMSVETPGLMTGIAGIGYELLRLAEPERIPNLLILEEPPACRRPPSSLLEPFAAD